jgi:hypothetical protein
LPALRGLQFAEKLTSHTAVPSVAEATVGFAVLTARLEAAPFQKQNSPLQKQNAIEFFQQTV